MKLNEHLIECKVERMTDKVDARYMNGEYSDNQYREEIQKIDAWAESQYAALSGEVTA